MSFDKNIDRYLFIRKIAMRGLEFNLKKYVFQWDYNQMFGKLQRGTEITYF